MEKFALLTDVMEVINPDINFAKEIHNLGLVQCYVDQNLKDPTSSEFDK